MRIKKDDQVAIISGKYRGRKGKVLKAFPAERRIVVEGINLRKKHQRARKTGEKGEVVEIPAPIDVSNAKIICPKCKETTRVGYKIAGETKYRFCKKCGKTI
ncbi:50S ribosomal protein L24 [Parcubacteria bacterium DG_74_3]|nr:MAG: 50S ribosomal protein L24 [Parcubacteria bacterium DG_74_3]